MKIVQLLKLLGWMWIGLLAFSDGCGESFPKLLETEFLLIDNFIAFTQMIPILLNAHQINQRRNIFLVLFTVIKVIKEVWFGVTSLYYSKQMEMDKRVDDGEKGSTKWKGRGYKKKDHSKEGGVVILLCLGFTQF